MTSVVTQCPYCFQKYGIGEEFVGCEISCKAPKCGRSFEAKVLTTPFTSRDTVQSAHVALTAQDVGQILGEEPPPIPIRSMQRPRGADGFANPAAFGRVIFYAGLFLLVAAFLYPSTVPAPDSSSRKIVNYPRAYERQLMATAGTGLVVAGASFWTQSQSSPRRKDLIAIGFALGFILLATIVDFVKLPTNATLRDVYFELPQW